MHPNRKRKASPEENDQRRVTLPVRMRHEAPTYIVKTGENDILLGRGKPIINNIGNRKFRELVKTRKEEYSNSPRSHTKELIAREILEVIQQRRGRFLQPVTPEMRDEDASIPDNPKVWRVVDLDVALSKIKQTLRDPEYIRSSERQQEAVAFIEKQHRLALQPSWPSLSTSSARVIPPVALLTASLAQQPLPAISQPLSPPHPLNPPDLALLLQLQMINQQWRQADHCLEQQPHQLMAQQQRAASISQQPQIFPNPPGVSSAQPVLPLAEARMLREYLQSQQGGGMGLSSAAGSAAIQQPLQQLLPPPVDTTLALDMMNVSSGRPMKTPEDDASDEDDKTAALDDKRPFSPHS